VGGHIAADSQGSSLLLPPLSNPKKTSVGQEQQLTVPCGQHPMGWGSGVLGISGLSSTPQAQEPSGRNKSRDDKMQPVVSWAYNHLGKSLYI
jgi:hypothetical protein